MKKGIKIATIVLLVLAVALFFVAVRGTRYTKQEAEAAASYYDTYLEETGALIAESEQFIAQAETAVANIEGYAAAIAAYTTDAEINASAQALVTSAMEDLESMRGQLEKLNAAVAVAEDADQETCEDALSKASKYRNGIERNLKKITKVEATESTKSYETQVEELYDDAFTGGDAQEFVPQEFTPTETETAEETTGGVDAFLAGASNYLYWLGGIAVLAMVLCLLGWTTPSTLKKIGAVANKNMMLVALITITLIFFVFTNYTILTPTNVSNIINQNAYIIILACGMLLCIVCSGNIDLSVGRVMGFIGACAAKMMIEGKMATIPAVILCLLIGIAIGMWQGFWISYMHIPAFIVTLAGQLLFYGLSMLILQGFTISNFPATFQNMFCSFIPDPFGGVLFGIQMNVLAMLVGIVAAAIVVFLQIRSRAQRRRKGYSLEPIGTMIIRTVIVSAVILWLFYSLAKARGIPSVLITVGIVLLIYAYITSKTVMGRHLYAMGGNVNAARLSGVKTQKMLFLAYVNMGLLAALAGLVYAARLNASSPQAGDGDELYAIASCYIGGASAYGGIGTVGGALIGALTMGVIKNGMSIMGLGQAIQQMVLGMVLLAAVVIDVVSKQKISFPFSFHVHKKEKK